jgi:hypothetical protein
MAFFSLLFGIGIGAAAVIGLSGNNTADDARIPHGVGSASIISEDRTEPVLSYKSPQAIEKELNKDHTGKPDRSMADANSENHKPKATTTCEGNNPSCGNKPRAKRTPAANEALAIGRAPLGRSDASAGMISAAPLESSERAQSTGSEAATAADRLNPDRPMNKKLHKIVPNRPPQGAPDYRDARGASRIGGGYNRPAGELDRAYALDRSNGSRGFWDWSRWTVANRCHTVCGALSSIEPFVGRRRMSVKTRAIESYKRLMQ